MKKLMGLSMVALMMCMPAIAQKTVVTVAAYPAVDDIVKAALQEWQKKNPNVEVKVVGREYADHHTAMTTALATSTGLPDVMTIEYGYLGRFAQSGGLQDLEKPPYFLGDQASKVVSFAMAQGRSASHGQVAMPTDIGPGAMFYRNDVLLKAQVTESELTQSWESFIRGGQKIKKATGAYLVAHARDVKDIVIRTGIPAGQGVYFDEQGKSIIENSPRFKRAFEIAQKIRTEGLCQNQSVVQRVGRIAQTRNCDRADDGCLAGGAPAKLVGTQYKWPLAIDCFTRAYCNFVGRNVLCHSQKSGQQGNCLGFDQAPDLEQQATANGI